MMGHEHGSRSDVTRRSGGHLDSRWGVATLLALAMWASPVAAEKGAAASNEARYQQAIRKALDEFAAGHWTEARIFFEDAHAISPNARTFRGLGATSYEARRYVDAISLLEQALACQVRPLTTQMAQETGRLLEEARRFVSPVDLTVEPSQAEVRLDGEAVPIEKRGRLIVDPGEHELTASAAGYEADRRVVMAEGGRRINVHLVLKRPEPLVAARGEPVVNEPMPLTAAATSQPTAAAHSDQSWALGVTLGVAGAAGIATGWVFFALRQNTREQQGDITLSRIAIYDDRGYAAVGAAAGGAALFSLSNYFWLPDSDGVPVAAWIAGGLGAAVGIGALALGVYGPRCDIGAMRQACSSVVGDDKFAPLLALHGLPLLSVPLSYALREWTRPSGVDVGLQLDPMPHGALLRVNGRF
jgi:hypothetical protein